MTELLPFRGRKLPTNAIASFSLVSLHEVVIYRSWIALPSRLRITIGSLVSNNNISAREKGTGCKIAGKTSSRDTTLKLYRCIRPETETL